MEATHPPKRPRSGMAELGAGGLSMPLPSLFELDIVVSKARIK